MLPITKMLITMNYSQGVAINPQYIVIHETDNEEVGANAVANRSYFANHSEAQASTHFVVDDHSIIQCAEIDWKCWHVGDNKGHSDITNSNSLGIEICVNTDGNYDKARSNAIDLTNYLMNITKLGSDKVVRHFDASGKYCPSRMIDNPNLWTDFKNKLSGQVSNNLSEEELFNNMFSEKFYLITYPDVAKAVANKSIPSGKAHYITYGKKEGRNPCPPLPENYNEGVYLSNNLDVKNAVSKGDYANGAEHFCMYGFTENRKYC